MNSSQDESVLLNVTENQKLIVSKALLSLSAVYFLGIGTGLAVYHFFIV
jgi:hypothetical protein